MRWTRRQRKVAERDPNGRRLIDDESVAYRLGRSAARIEAALSAPSIFGRVAIAQTMRDVSPDLMDILGTASALPIGTDGAADDGAANYVYRFAPLVGIYGGTLEVFRNMIAQYVLGLGKPNYSAPAPAQESLLIPRSAPSGGQDGGGRGPGRAVNLGEPDPRSSREPGVHRPRRATAAPARASAATLMRRSVRRWRSVRRQC